MKLVITNQLIGQLMVLIEYDKMIGFVNTCNNNKMMDYNTFQDGIDVSNNFFFFSELLSFDCLKNYKMSNDNKKY